METKLFNLASDLECVCVEIDKLRFLVDVGYDIVTPCNSNYSEQNQARQALQAQPRIEKTLSMIIDYMDNIKEKMENLTYNTYDMCKTIKSEIKG